MGLEALGLVVGAGGHAALGLKDPSLSMGKRVRVPIVGSQGKQTERAPEPGPKRSRVLLLPRTASPAQSQDPSSLKRRRLNPCGLHHRLVEDSVPYEALPEHEAQLTRITARLGSDFVSKGQNGGEQSSGSSTSEIEEEPRDARRRQKALIAKSKNRRWKHLQMTMEEAMGQLTPLERGNLIQVVNTSYEKYYQEFRTYCERQGFPLASDTQVDLAMTLYFNDRFLKGESSHHGEKTMAAWAHRHASFGRFGARKLPRSWRSIKGWRKLAPGRSRLAYPLVALQDSRLSRNTSGSKSTTPCDC